MDVKFYLCKHCGNVAVKVFDSEVPLVCCGEEMVEMVANTTDAAVEKHVPVVSVDGGQVRVQVGSVEHPMTPEHFITFICLVTNEGYRMAPLSPDGKPEAVFTLGEGEVPLKVYEYCNLHGLWVAEVSAE